MSRLEKKMLAQNGLTQREVDFLTGRISPLDEHDRNELRGLVEAGKVKIVPPSAPADLNVTHTAKLVQAGD